MTARKGEDNDTGATADEEGDDASGGDRHGRGDGRNNGTIERGSEFRRSKINTKDEVRT